MEPMDITITDKSQSRLLALPAELRNKIYHYLLGGGHIIHIGGTGHQPYAEDHKPAGRCSSCVATTSDAACFAQYTGRRNALKGTLPEDRFSKRHRDCHRYPVSHVLNLDILAACRQTHDEAAAIVFEENVFTLARPHSLPPFLERLTPLQMRSLRTMMIYSVESTATWLGPFYHASDFEPVLTGFQTLRIFVELKPWDFRAGRTEDSVRGEQARLRMWLPGAAMFKLSSLRCVELMAVTPDWYQLENEALSDATVDRLKEWEGSVRQMLMPLAPLQRLVIRSR